MKKISKERLEELRSNIKEIKKSRAFNDLSGKKKPTFYFKSDPFMVECYFDGFETGWVWFEIDDSGNMHNVMFERVFDCVSADTRYQLSFMLDIFRNS